MNELFNAERPMRKSLAPKNLISRGIPKHLIEVSVTDLDDFGSEERRKFVDFMTNYLNNINSVFQNNQGLFLFGSNGVGKSFCSCLIVKMAYAYRYTSRRCTFMEYITEYTRLWNIKNADEKEQAEGMFYHKYKAVEFLVLEEIGKELDTKLAPTVLEDLLRYREERGLVTIICTNLEPKDVIERYGNSVGSLIKGNFTPVRIVGSDKRTQSYGQRVSS